MKYSDLRFAPRLLRLPEAEAYVGGQQTLKAMRCRAWVAPVIEHKGNTSFDIRDLDRACDRLKVEGEQALFGSVDEVNRVVVVHAVYHFDNPKQRLSAVIRGKIEKRRLGLSEVATKHKSGASAISPLARCADSLTLTAQETKPNLVGITEFAKWATWAMLSRKSTPSHLFETILIGRQEIMKIGETDV